jgi:hypothetical protein
MDVHADSTCKYLVKGARKRKGLTERCCTLRLMAMGNADAGLLTALYHLLTYGGKVSIDSPKHELHFEGEWDGFMDSKPSAHEVGDEGATK